METTQLRPEWQAAVDEIWAMFREDRERMKEDREQMREYREQMKEADRKMQETREQMKETDRRMKETDKRVGELSNRFGEMVEHMVIPNLLKKFNEMDFTFTKAGRNKIEDWEHNIFTEVDAFLENGDKVMIVEIKNKPNIDDINDHIARMEKLRIYADLHSDKRTYLGAVAGVIFGVSEKTYAFKKGFYVIEPTGDTFSITAPTGAYYPHEW